MKRHAIKLKFCNNLTTASFGVMNFFVFALDEFSRVSSEIYWIVVKIIGVLLRVLLELIEGRKQ